MSKLTGDLEVGSTSASPLLPMTVSPASFEHGTATIPPTVETLTTHGTANILSIETRENYIIHGIPFYHAAINGDCREAIKICKLQPDIVRARITSESETGLHIAAATKNLSFVRMLVQKMTPDEIRMTSKSNNTALCYAAASGIVDIAKVIVGEVKDLPLVRGKGGMTPLHMAAELGHKEMVNYLLPLTDKGNELTAGEVMKLFISLINTDLYEVAKDLLTKYPTLATARDKQGQGETALHVLARKPISSTVDLDRGHWKGLITSGLDIDDSIKSHKNATALFLVKYLWEIVVQILDDRSISELITVPTQLLFVAIKSGNVEFITILIKYYPDLIWCVNHERRSMFHVAVYERQENIFRIIYEIGARKDLILVRNDSKNNNMLHMAAKLAPSNRLGIVSGAALQLQRELMWFKEVEKIVPPSYKEMKNNEGLTPKELFNKDHKELRKEGEKWMKSTAQSCMIVSTLVATVMFTAAFNLPGGRMDNIVIADSTCIQLARRENGQYCAINGTPNYLKKPSFLIFVIADSMSLFSAITTIFACLSILTSRYKAEDFLHALPSKLIQGLLALFVSMVMMMIAFTASMFTVFDGKSIGAAIAISCAAVLPVLYYPYLHFRLFADILSSTYNSKFIFHSRVTSLVGPDLKTIEDVNPKLRRDTTNVNPAADLKTKNLEMITVQNEKKKSQWD